MSPQKLNSKLPKLRNLLSLKMSKPYRPLTSLTRLRDRMTSLKSQGVAFRSRATTSKCNAATPQRTIALVIKSRENPTNKTSLVKGASVKRHLCLANDRVKK